MPQKTALLTKFKRLSNPQWQSWVELLPQDRNGGFAFGNNAAIRPLMASPHPPDFCWLLNSDTLVLPGALSTLLQALEADQKVGIVGSRLENRDGTSQVSAFRFPSITSEFLSTMRLGVLDKMFASFVVAPLVQNQAHFTDWLSGASFLVRRNVFEQVGLLDEGFFLYFEEVEFCLPLSTRLEMSLRSCQPCHPFSRPKYRHSPTRSSPTSILV